jgi:hypothetical protein
MTAEDNSDLDRQLRDLLRGDIERAVLPTDENAIVARFTDSGRIGDEPRRRSWLVLMAATVLVAAVATGVLLRVLHIGEVASGPSPSTSSGASGSILPVSPTPATSSISPRPSGLSYWQLVQLELPAELEGYLVTGVSPDGARVLVQEPQAAQSVRLIVSSTDIRDLVAPEHTTGAPIGSALSPDARFVLLSELGQAWIYDIDHDTYTKLPNPPGTTGGSFWVANASNLVVLTGPRASHEFGGTTNTQLWRLDLDTLTYSELGARHDGINVFPAEDGGAMLVTDTSAEHDNSGWVLFQILPDGSDRLFLDLGASYPTPLNLAVGLNGGLDGRSVVFGQSVAFTVGDDLRVMYFDGRAAAAQIGLGHVMDFSPDSLLLRVAQADGSVQAMDRTGALVTSLPQTTTGWILAE